MSKKNLLLLIIFTCVVFLSYQISHALFSDTATSTNNTFVASDTFLGVTTTITPTATPTVTSTPTPTITPTPTTSIANHLVINEALYDTSTSQNIDGVGGSNRGEWVEIYNPTNSDVSLSSWTIEDNDGISGAEALSGTVPPSGYLILTGATSSEFQTIWTVPVNTLFIQASGGKIGNGLANGGDRVVLKDNNGLEIDRMSWGTDTSGFVTGCGGSCPTVSSGHSLERNPDGKDTDSASDFIDQSPPTPGS